MVGTQLKPPYQQLLHGLQHVNDVPYVRTKLPVLDSMKTALGHQQQHLKEVDDWDMANPSKFPGTISRCRSLVSILSNSIRGSCFQTTAMLHEAVSLVAEPKNKIWQIVCK